MEHRLYKIKKLRVMDKMAGIPDEFRGSRLKASYHQLRDLLCRFLHVNVLVRVAFLPLIPNI